MKTIKKYLGEILIIIGTILTSYNIFDFTYKTHNGTCLPALCESISGAVYYYSQNTIIFITIGITLITTGILITRNKK